MRSRIEDPHYVIVHGDVWYQGHDSRHRVCGPSDELAVAYDEVDGTLHKHGPIASVREWMNRTQHALRQSGFHEMADQLVTMTFPVLPETITELNACIACSGRVLGMRDRLVRPQASGSPRLPS